MGVGRGIDNPTRKKMPVRKPEMWPWKGLRRRSIMEAKANTGLVVPMKKKKKKIDSLCSMTVYRHESGSCHSPF